MWGIRCRCHTGTLRYRYRSRSQERSGAIRHPGSREIGRIYAQMSGIRVIGGYVVRVRCDGYGLGEIHLLPARGSLVCKSGTG